MTSETTAGIELERNNVYECVTQAEVETILNYELPYIKIYNNNPQIHQQ